jgi:glycosyltransferase involved in cell wall biosynthesis
VDLLVDAVAILATKRDDFKVNVIGKDAVVAPGWSTFVQNSGRTLPITYTPALSQTEILERLRGADLLVQPSEHEEFGSAVAEALACGVPVVTGPTNGTGQYAPADGSARFDRYEPQSVAEAIERALALSRHPEARAACRIAAQAFAPELVAEKVAAFIEQARQDDARTTLS